MSEASPLTAQCRTVKIIGLRCRGSGKTGHEAQVLLLLIVSLISTYTVLRWNKNAIHRAFRGSKSIYTCLMIEGPYTSIGPDGCEVWLWAKNSM